MHNYLNTVKEEECKVRNLGNVEKHGHIQKSGRLVRAADH